MKETKWYNCGSSFNVDSFNYVCYLLESGETVRICIDCIGHCHNNTVQLEYKNALMEKYNDRLNVIPHQGAYRFSYSYSLTE